MRQLILLIALLFLKVKVDGQIFLPAVCYNVGNSPRCLVSDDFDGDGDLDIATSDWGGNTATVILGNGDGTFAAPTTYTVGIRPQEICSADFNGDGFLDLVTTNFLSNNLSILFGMGNGSFAQADTLHMDGQPMAIVSKDFNIDGNMDIAVTLYAEHKIAILLGDGVGGFGTPIKYQTGGSGPLRLICADFYEDGIMDLVAVNRISKSVSILTGYGNGGFSVPDVYYLFYPSTITYGDFNVDGHLDIFVGTESGSSGGVLLGDGLGQFSLNTIPFDFGFSGITTSICTSDFNEDGKLDIVTNKQPSDTVSLVQGIVGLDSFSTNYTNYFSICGRPFFLMSADFNKDGHADLATANDNATTVSIYLNSLPPTPNFIIESFTTNNDLIVYPNPASNKVSIIFYSPQIKFRNIEMFDIIGRQINNIPFRNNDQEILIEVNELDSGMYTYKVMCENNIKYFGKLIIDR